MLSDKMITDIHNVLDYYIKRLNDTMFISNCNVLALDIFNYKTLDVEIVNGILKLRLYDSLKPCIYSTINLDMPVHLINGDYHKFITELINKTFDGVDEK